MHLEALKRMTDTFPDTAPMPVLFVGHGNPMNALEDNVFSQTWRRLGRELPTPQAILCISAHWETRGTHVTISPFPKTIHDFGGFPDALYQVQYPASGSEALALGTKDMLHPHAVSLDPNWGLDHGCWSVLLHMYPEAKIPVVQLSLDRRMGPAQHVALAQQLQPLRRKGILIVASGNIVHNLGVMDFSRTTSAYDWALDANDQLKSLISARDIAKLCNYPNLGLAVKQAIPTPEHYLPLLYALGASDTDAAFFNDAIVLGSIAMTGMVFR